MEKVMGGVVNVDQPRLDESGPVNGLAIQIDAFDHPILDDNVEGVVRVPRGSEREPRRRPRAQLARRRARAVRLGGRPAPPVRGRAARPLSAA